jgi:polyisoprenoid-binding protein YceI
MNKLFFSALALLFCLCVSGQSGVTFKIKNAGFNVNGKFEKYTTNIVYNPAEPAKASFSGTISVTSINTNINKRDEHLRKNDYFDVAKYPNITFKSNSVREVSAGMLEVSGTLKIKNVSKTVVMPVSVKKVGNQHEFTGNLEINRRDYEVGGSSLILSDKVVITIREKA